LFSHEELEELRNEHVEALLAEGRRDRAAFQGLIHGEIHPQDFDLAAWQARAWLLEAWNLQGLLQMTLVGIAQGDTARDAFTAARIAPWITNSGLSAEEAGRELSRRIQAGEPMPWDDYGPRS